MTGVIDAAARAAVVNPCASFCVSAPAGSGKTELLIQRYLSLLSQVKRPEQVLAITFTRKAAAEMRQRVMHALQSVLAGDHCTSPHQQATRRLAEMAHAASEREGWFLLRNSSRFNIKTIDSFCAGLTRQMPVLSQFGGQARLQDDATLLYAEAVLELYKLVDEEHPVASDLAALMRHFDNNWQRLQELLVAMLARRDQWRGYVGVHFTPQESEAYLIATVKSLVRDELGELASLLAPYAADLLEILQFAATNLALNIPRHFPGSEPEDLAGWRAVTHLLLTRAGEWRKVLTVRDGFPSGRGEPQERKDQLQAILLQLRQIPGLQAKLAEVQTLPEIEAASVSWQVVLHLSRLLPTLAAQLLLVFQKRGVVDHSQVAQAALIALGDDDAPTDLALRLDYQIEHILVDEFQDTAITQYELLSKLTRGWGEYNEQHPRTPRTVMIVGDAMQSIYGFRGANVGLFLKARLEGFNGVKLHHLELLCNFRSNGDVVDWINQTFTGAFPAQDDVYRSQVRYRPATAVRSSTLGQATEMHAFEGEYGRAQEVAFICTRIADCVAGERGTLAVLGRRRIHLQPIIRRLKQLQIPYNASDLDSLARSPVVADLMTLCRALANHGDRLAWLALLRAPWCGLQLADLLTIARFGDEPPYTAVWSSLQKAELLNALSDDGRVRVQHVLPVLHQASRKRDRLGLRVWVEQVWVGLGGPLCVPEMEGLRDAENFLQLLEQAEVEGVGLDVDWLSLRLRKLYMSTGNPDSKVHLMTLHKAKGLEFDRVIIPQLDRLPRSDAREILLWDEHSNALGQRSFLLAADDLASADAPTLYNYLKAQRQQKMLLESTRLLYVGTTRAISHLLLTARVTRDEKTARPRKPSPHSLLSPIWQTFAQQMIIHPSSAAVKPAVPARQVPPLTRLPHKALRILPSSSPEPALPEAVSRITVHADDHVERGIGTVVHLAMKELSRRAQLPGQPDARDRLHMRMALQLQGLWGDALNNALKVVVNSIAQMLHSGYIGRWVLSCGHLDAHSDWTLTNVDSQGVIKDIVIDRSFIDRETGQRWVIDYNNSRPTRGESLEGFVVRQSANCFHQLRLHRDVVRQLGQEPLRCAVFFTSLGHLHRVPELDLPGVQKGTQPCDS